MAVAGLWRRFKRAPLFCLKDTVNLPTRCPVMLFLTPQGGEVRSIPSFKYDTPPKRVFWSVLSCWGTKHLIYRNIRSFAHSGWQYCQALQSSNHFTSSNSFYCLVLSCWGTKHLMKRFIRSFLSSGWQLRSKCFTPINITRFHKLYTLASCHAEVRSISCNAALDPSCRQDDSSVVNALPL